MRAKQGLGLLYLAFGVMASVVLAPHAGAAGPWDNRLRFTLYGTERHSLEPYDLDADRDEMTDGDRVFEEGNSPSQERSGVTQPERPGGASGTQTARPAPADDRSIPVLSAEGALELGRIPHGFFETDDPRGELLRYGIRMLPQASIVYVASLSPYSDIRAASVLPLMSLMASSGEVRGVVDLVEGDHVVRMRMPAFRKRIHERLSHLTQDSSLDVLRSYLANLPLLDGVDPGFVQDILMGNLERWWLQFQNRERELLTEVCLNILHLKESPPPWLPLFQKVVEASWKRDPVGSLGVRVRVAAEMDYRMRARYPKLVQQWRHSLSRDESALVRAYAWVSLRGEPSWPSDVWSLWYDGLKTENIDELLGMFEAASFVIRGHEEAETKLLNALYRQLELYQNGDLTRASVLRSGLFLLRHCRRPRGLQKFLIAFIVKGPWEYQGLAARWLGTLMLDAEALAEVRSWSEGSMVSDLVGRLTRGVLGTSPAPRSLSYLAMRRVLKENEKEFQTTFERVLSQVRRTPSLMHLDDLGLGPFFDVLTEMTEWPRVKRSQRVTLMTNLFSLLKEGIRTDSSVDLAFIDKVFSLLRSRMERDDHAGVFTKSEFKQLAAQYQRYRDRVVAKACGEALD